MRARSNGSPAKLMVQTFCGTPAISRSFAIKEGTVLIRVTRCAFGRFGNTNRFSARITEPPQHSGANISNIDRSKHNEVEASTPESSRLLNTSRAQCRKVTMLRCSTTTPFGDPVDPDV